MFRWKRLTAAAAVVGLGLTGCSGHSGTSGSSGGGTLTLGSLAQPTSYAAAGAGWANESPVQQAVYDQLLHATADTDKPLPWLATSWSYDSSKTVLTMKLRSDVKFTDGTKFDASAAAQNLIRFRDGTSSDKSHLASIKTAQAVDATTLKLTLTQPDPALLTNLSTDAGSMESPKAFGNANAKTAPVGSGPYILDTKQTVIGSKYVYDKNPDYFAKSTQHWAHLIINIYTSTATQLNAIKGNQVQGVNLLDNSIVTPILATKGWTIAKQEYNWAGIALFDRDGKQSKPLGDVRVRQAINYAIDKAAMLKAAGQGFGTLTGQVWPTYGPAYEASLDDAYPYDPAKAKQLLAAAGYSHFTLSLPNITGFGTTANDLIKQYLAAVGITVQFTTVPVTNAITDVLAPKYPAAYFTLQEDPVPYQEANFLFSPTAVFNPFKVNDPKIVAFVKTMAVGSEADANAAAKALNQYTTAQAWNDPWYRPQSSFAVASTISVKQQAGNAYPYLYYITPKG